MSFGLDNLPYGVLLDDDGRRRAVVRFEDAALELERIDAALFAAGTLDAFLAAGPQRWADVRGAATEAIRSDRHPLRPLAPASDRRPALGFTVADYVDFYASEHHAGNAGRIFRPERPARPANWRHVPIGYHGRSGSVVASGPGVERPRGVLAAGRYGPSERLDFEAELAFVVGIGGRRIGVADADHHVFGVCLLNDWSARDIQRFETVPLGPFLGKSFATSVSPWITPLAALEQARRPAPVQDPPPLPHLTDTGRHAFDIELEVRLNGQVISRPRFADMYWTYAQMLAHLTSNGAPVRTGDLFASGTVSGPEPGQRGCLLELTWDGQEPIDVGGQARAWLADGDVVTIAARAGDVTLGEVSDAVRPDPMLPGAVRPDPQRTSPVEPDA
jgi:fumarylacetoacetase